MAPREKKRRDLGVGEEIIAEEVVPEETVPEEIVFPWQGE